MRITGGEFRGRVIKVPDIRGLRPTPAKVRQALFNILGDIEGLSCLDLFSGSGIMALEALSRGASCVTSVEAHGRICHHLHQLVEQFQLDERWHIQRGKLPHALEQFAHQHIDFIFADPPYEKGFAEKIPQWLAEHDITVDRLVIEESAKVTPQWGEAWEVDTRRYGDTCLHICYPQNKKARAEASG